MTTTHDEPRHVLEDKIARLEAQVTELEGRNRRLSDDLDFHRRQRKADREAQLRTLEECTTMYENLTATQTRCSELLELSRDASIIDEQVREFHEVCGDVDPYTPTVPVDAIVRLRLRLVLEEAFEFFEACAVDKDTVESLWDETRAAIDALAMAPDIVEVADALADLDYVSAGTRLAYGIPRKPIADEVHRANMAKAPGGVILRSPQGKIIKPEGWTPPNIRKALGLE